MTFDMNLRTEPALPENTPFPAPPAPSIHGEDKSPEVRFAGGVRRERRVSF